MQERIVGRRVVASVLAVVSLSAGCADDPKPAAPEAYEGRFILKPEGMAYADTDLVELNVEGPVYGLTHLTHSTAMCDSKGTVVNFGKNRCDFTPTYIDKGNCDSVHIPDGDFQAIFSGDSLRMIQIPDSNAWGLLYTFELKRK
jgi:hypothetical protein